MTVPLLFVVFVPTSVANAEISSPSTRFTLVIELEFIFRFWFIVFSEALSSNFGAPPLDKIIFPPVPAILQISALRLSVNRNSPFDAPILTLSFNVINDVAFVILRSSEPSLSNLFRIADALFPILVVFVPTWVANAEISSPSTKLTFVIFDEPIFRLPVIAIEPSIDNLLGSDATAGGYEDPFIFTTFDILLLFMSKSPVIARLPSIDSFPVCKFPISVVFVPTCVPNDETFSPSTLPTFVIFSPPISRLVASSSNLLSSAVVPSRFDVLRCFPTTDGNVPL